MTEFNKFNYKGSVPEQTSGTPTPIENIEIEYLVIGGGGGGSGAFSSNTQGAGGGAGGYLNSYASENSGGNNSTLTPKYIGLTKKYYISIGAGGGYGGNDTGGGGQFDGYNGSPTIFDNVIALGGGGAIWNSETNPINQGVFGSGGGGRSNLQIGTISPTIQTLGKFTNERTHIEQTMGSVGRNASTSTSYGSRAGGGGGGASGDSSTYTHSTSGVAGLSSSITGSAVTRGAGGGGRGSGTGNGSNGTANYGNGGQGGAYQNFAYGSRRGGNGGSGVVIIRYASTDANIVVGAGLTQTSATDGADTVVTFTAGSGYIWWRE